MYKWGQKIFRPTRGGTNGLRATGSVARLVMDFWCAKMKEMINENGMTCPLLKMYVDDVLLVVWKLGLGFRWTGDKLEHSQEWENQDIEMGITC